MPYFTSLFNAFPNHSLKRLALPVAMKQRTQQIFVCHVASTAEGISLMDGKGDIIKDDKISTVVKNSDGLIVKFIKARRWHEYYKVFYGASRTSKEVQSNVRLKELGLTVPEVTEYGIALIPTHFFGYTGYYVMGAAPGLGDAHECFDRLDEQAKNRFVDQLIQDLTLLKANRIIYGDLAMRNLFCGEQGELCWIDTGIDEYPASKQKRFATKWKKMLKKFLGWERDKGLLNQQQLSRIKALL